MRSSTRRAIAAALAAGGIALGLAGCAATVARPLQTPEPRSKVVATFTGSESGTVRMNLCSASGDDSIVVVVRGTSTRLPGVVSSTTMNFDGRDAIYTIDSTGPLPRFSTDRSTVTLDGVILRSALDPAKKLTFSGSIACP